MAKQYALKGHIPGPFIAGNLGYFDTRKMDEATAQSLIKKGVPLEEFGLVKTVKTNAVLPAPEVAEDPESEKNTTK